MKNSELRLASISDIHLGNRRVRAREIIEKLDRAFPNDHTLKELDVIFIGGDVFDRPLSLHEEDSTEIRIWIARFLRRCKKHDVMVRIVEGTPSHDWNQSDLFESINRIAKIECDVLYHKDLCIEYIERLGIHVLYVPDEWEHESDETWKQVKQLLHSHGLDKVDFAIMHGAFEYQLPSHVQAPTHDEERYLSIVRYFIFIGHVHRHLPKGRIIPNGSFDRLAHGEEEDKGHVRALIRKKGDHEITFIPNKDAKSFITIDCEGLDIAEALEKIDSICKDLRDDSHVRVKASRKDSIVGGLDSIRSKYPTFNWTTKFSTQDVDKADTLNDLRAKFKGVEITKDNIVNLLMNRIEKNINDPKLVRRTKHHLEEAV